jgi:hypothetical protein
MRRLGMLRLGSDMVIDTPFFHCFSCRRRFRPEPEAQEGRFIEVWKVPVCVRCISGNSLGLAADHPAIQRLARNGVVLAKPIAGFIPWPPEPNANPRDRPPGPDPRGTFARTDRRPP